jgi:AcrR family transcriptional regulator
MDVAVTKTDKSRKKRRAILEAAAKVFREKGYAEATLADIAELANTFSGSLYYYFSSKEQLVEEVLNIGTTSVSDLVMKKLAKVDKETGIVARIQLALVEHMTLMLRRDDFVVAYWKIIEQVPADIRERHRRLPRAYGRFWQQLLDEGRDTGVLRNDLDMTVVRLLLMGSTIYALQWFDDQRGSTIEDIADTMVAMFFDGMVAK